MATTNTDTYFLFQNRTTDGNSDPVAVEYPNKTTIVKVWGTFDGASVKFQNLAPQSDPEVWIDVPDVNGNTLLFSANGQSVIEYLVYNERLRAVVSSAGASTTINASLEIY
jgi:hypothetical protein